MKETALEWFMSQLKQVDPKAYTDMLFDGFYAHALELEKQQIIEAHGDKKKLKSNPDSCVTYKYTFTGKDYYEQYYQKPFLTK
jgi:hypothetical protein